MFFHLAKSRSENKLTFFETQSIKKICEVGCPQPLHVSRVSQDPGIVLFALFSPQTKHTLCLIFFQNYAIEHRRSTLLVGLQIQLGSAINIPGIDDNLVHELKSNLLLLLPFPLLSLVVEISRLVSLQE